MPRETSCGIRRNHRENPNTSGALYFRRKEGPMIYTVIGVVLIVIGILVVAGYRL